MMKQFGNFFTASWLRQGLVVLLALLLPHSPLMASCTFPAAIERSPDAAAKAILNNNLVVGFATITRKRNREGPESLDMIYPLKGPPGLVMLDHSDQKDGRTIVDNHARTFAEPLGSMLFVALGGAKDRLVVTECTQQLFDRFGTAKLIKEMRKLVPPGVQPKRLN